MIRDIKIYFSMTSKLLNYYGKLNDDYAVFIPLISNIILKSPGNLKDILFFFINSN